MDAAQTSSQWSFCPLCNEPASLSLDSLSQENTHGKIKMFCVNCGVCSHGHFRTNADVCYTCLYKSGAIEDYLKKNVADATVHRALPRPPCRDASCKRAGRGWSGDGADDDVGPTTLCASCSVPPETRAEWAPWVAGFIAALEFQHVSLLSAADAARVDQYRTARASTSTTATTSTTAAATRQAEESTFSPARAAPAPAARPDVGPDPHDAPQRATPSERVRSDTMERERRLRSDTLERERRLRSDTLERERRLRSDTLEREQRQAEQDARDEASTALLSAIKANPRALNHRALARPHGKYVRTQNHPVVRKRDAAAASTFHGTAASYITTLVEEEESLGVQSLLRGATEDIGGSELSAAAEHFKSQIVAFMECTEETLLATAGKAREIGNLTTDSPGDVFDAIQQDRAHIKPGSILLVHLETMRLYAVDPGDLLRMPLREGCCCCNVS